MIKPANSDRRPSVTHYHVAGDGLILKARQLQRAIDHLAIAFAFFRRGDVTFTLGSSQWAWALCSLPLVRVGILTATDYATGGFEGWNRVGAYAAPVLMLAFAGRQYYATIGR